MGIDQDHVADIIRAASADDPAVRMQNLTREVDLLKIAIKHILMDIRERMNELENPFTLVSSAQQGGGEESAADQETEIKESALEAREAALDARESALEEQKTKAELEAKKEKDAEKTAPAPVLDPGSIPSTLTIPAGAGIFSVMPPEEPPADVLPLPKVHALFSWTKRGVRTYGFEYLDILVESYCVMGYVGQKNADEIRQLTRLMPANSGEEREIGADEFVYELYALKRILSPDDNSLDRDMIEVLMEQRGQEQIREKVAAYRTTVLGHVPGKDMTGSSAFIDHDPTRMNFRI